MKAETKYEVGQTLWTVTDAKIVEFKVRKAEVSADSEGVNVYYYPECGYSCHREPNCFATKEELVARLGL